MDIPQNFSSFKNEENLLLVYQIPAGFNRGSCLERSTTFQTILYDLFTGNSAPTFLTDTYPVTSHFDEGTATPSGTTLHVFTVTDPDGGTYSMSYTYDPADSEDLFTITGIGILCVHLRLENRTIFRFLYFTHTHTHTRTRTRTHAHTRKKSRISFCFDNE